MESLKFEISTATQQQLQRVKEVLNEVNSINEWKIAPYVNGYLVSLRGVNMQIVNILSCISALGLDAECLYEE